MLAATIVVGSAMVALSGDAEDCANPETLLKTDPARAVAACRRLADQGDSHAEGMLGIMYFSGQGVPQDYTTAAFWYRKAADQGFALAQYGLGIMFYTGSGMPQDYAQTLKWWQKAAGQGFLDAQFNLGVMYDGGRGVPQDYAEAIKWYRKAADRGFPDAQTNLGLMYANGKGVPEDYVQALMWCVLAVAGNSAYVQDRNAAIKNRDTVAAKMTPAQIAEAQRLAREWKPTTP
jgi:uncharacterized protein